MASTAQNHIHRKQIIHSAARAGVYAGAALAAVWLAACGVDPTDDGGGDTAGTPDDGTLQISPDAAATGCGTLASGASLSPGQSVTSCKNGYQLIMQTDGNLVLYASGHRALWSSRTNGKGGWVAAMQGDGNLVVYTAGNRDEHRALWASGTNNHPGARLAVQDDGNAVIYLNSKAIWATNTVQGTVSCANQWWDGSRGWSFYVRSSLYNGLFNGHAAWDNDIFQPHSPVQLRHPAKLIVASPGGAKTCCGYVPRFQDTVTGQLFQFIHLQNINFSTKDEGKVFPAGFVVGTSGGDTPDTNCNRATCGDLFAHLCVQTEDFSGNHASDWVRSIGPQSHDNSCR